MEGMEYNTRKNQKCRRKGKMTIWELLKTDTIKQKEMKEKITEEYLRLTRKFLEINSAAEISSNGQIRGRYSWKILRPMYKLDKELRKIDLWTRKLMTMHKALHPRDGIKNYMCQKDDPRTLKIAWMHQYNSKTTLKEYSKSNYSVQ